MYVCMYVYTTIIRFLLCILFIYISTKDSIVNSN